MEDEEFFPCVCCGIYRQTETGFCESCERGGCVVMLAAQD